MVQPGIAFSMFLIICKSKASVLINCSYIKNSVPTKRFSVQIEHIKDYDSVKKDPILTKKNTKPVPLIMF